MPRLDHDRGPVSDGARTFPLAPLLAWYGPVFRLVPHAYTDRPCVVATATAVLAELLGITPRTIQRWRAKGLTLDNVERVTARLGVHPCEVWPDLWWQP